MISETAGARMITRASADTTASRTFGSMHWGLGAWARLRTISPKRSSPGKLGESCQTTTSSHPSSIPIRSMSCFSTRSPTGPRTWFGVLTVSESLTAVEAGLAIRARFLISSSNIVPSRFRKPSELSCLISSNACDPPARQGHGPHDRVQRRGDGPAALCSIPKLNSLCLPAGGPTLSSEQPTKPGYEHICANWGISCRPASETTECAENFRELTPHCGLPDLNCLKKPQAQSPRRRPG